MALPSTPDKIAKTRTVSADAILRNQVDLRGYPFRHVSVVARYGFSGGTSPVTEVLMAVEVLQQAGWELVNVSEFSNGRFVHGIVRRR
ncbi:transcriptional regulator [Polymorphospora sp. NPDC050346]|uniref:transcriptional regulator n=1 Tax=Polymorphospora sp. NPDC050346 TaxID=3155780 RepID=UPI00340F70FC